MLIPIFSNLARLHLPFLIGWFFLVSLSLSLSAVHFSIEFPAGEEVVALLGLTNTGDRTYNLTYIGAHLHSAYDFSFFIQNVSNKYQIPTRCSQSTFEIDKVCTHCSR